MAEGGLIVEAKVIARCCFENSYWVGALVNEGDKFLGSMVHHEMKHKRMGAKTIFSTTGGQGEIGGKLQGAMGELRQWMRDYKQYEDSPTLDPKEVCKRAQSATYMFYQYLSWEAHPSAETLNRYYDPQDASGALRINVEPAVWDAEVIVMLGLMCSAVLIVFRGIVYLLGRDTTAVTTMEAEFQVLTERSGPLFQF